MARREATRSWCTYSTSSSAFLAANGSQFHKVLSRARIARRATSGAYSSADFASIHLLFRDISARSAEIVSIMLPEMC